MKRNSSNSGYEVVYTSDCLTDGIGREGGGEPKKKVYGVDLYRLLNEKKLRGKCWKPEKHREKILGEKKRRVKV